MKISAALLLIILASCARPDGAKKEPFRGDDGYDEEVELLDSENGGSDDSANDDESSDGYEDETTGMRTGGGDWVVSCTITGNISVEKSFRISDSHFIFREIGFDDLACGNAQYSITKTFLLRNYSGVTNHKIDSYEIDLQLESFSITPLSSIESNKFNDSKFCEVTSWQPFVENEVAGQSCEGLSALDLNQVIYTIMELDLKTYGVRFGSIDVSADPGQRPDEYTSEVWKPTHL